jgi:hypothetical protein
MPAATAITPQDRPHGQQQQYSFSLTPGAIGAAGSETETVAISGASLNDAIVVTPPATGFANGIIVGLARVSAPGTVSFNINNITAGSLTPGAGTWTLTLLRGSTMAFAR